MRALALMAPLLAAGFGCASILDLHGVTVEHYVGGRVHGLWDGTDGLSLRLQTDGVDTLLTVTSNGSFKFPDLLVPGTSYTVSIMVNPLQHTCDFESGRNGKVADIDVTNIVVACLGPAVTVKTSPWDWKFDPTQEVQKFAGSIAMQSIAITLSGESVISASVNGNEVTLGEPTEVTALPLGATTVPVAFTAHGGLSKTYQLVLARGDAVLDQVVYGKASNTGASDHFGFSVALYGGTLAVGAHSGAVYVFVRNGATWVQQAYLKGSNTEAGDAFGSSVALFGDTLAVGAAGEESAATGPNGNQQDNSAYGAGAVYVFVRNGTTWVQQAYLKASNTGAGDVFGSSVALYGDTLAVSAPGEESAATGVDGDQQDNHAGRAGAVYVFVRNGATWMQQAYLKASNTESLDSFGYSVALYADTLAVGAPREDSAATGVNGDQQDNSATDAGAVYVFVRNGATWVQEAYLKASNAEAFDAFGGSVALYGDTLSVGAPLEDSAATGVNGDPQDNSAPGAGVVYVFVRNGATWMQQAYLKASSAEAFDAFGWSIALYGDTLSVGAPFEASAATGVNGNQQDNSAPYAGAVYVFVRNGATWMQQAYLKASNTGAGDYFGHSVALCGDTLAAGADSEASAATGLNGNQQDDTANAAGAVYIFR